MISDFAIPTALELYRSIFRDLLRSGSSRLIENSSPVHARIIISELIRFSHSSVDVFCDSLSPEVWNEEIVRDSIKEAITRGVVFRVVTQNQAKESDTKTLIDSVTKIKTLNRRVDIPNFIIVDKKAYRVEIDETQKIGVACASGGDDAKTIAEAFDRLYSQEI